MIDLMLTLNDETLDREIISSFRSVRETVHHMLNAETIWIQRLNLVEQPVAYGTPFLGSFADACETWQKVSGEVEIFIQRQYNDKSFEHVVQFYRNKQPFKNKVKDILMHMCNHSTYHRGQLVTMLRQLGETKIPGTDFTVFLRN